MKSRSLSLPRSAPPILPTIQTTVYRLEAKGAVRRGKKIGNAHIFDAAVTRDAAHRQSSSTEVLALFGGRIQPVMAHWIESGRVTSTDLREAEETLKQLSKARKDKAR